MNLDAPAMTTNGLHHLTHPACSALLPQQPVHLTSLFKTILKNRV